jgi:hypothetical protein
MEATALRMPELRRIEPWDLGRLFPMPDVASARLMKIKARCLCSAGVLPTALGAYIDRHADDLIVSDRSASPQFGHDIDESERV